MSVENKLKQVTDSIHGTIFLSSFESELISTPYFYRLHDIYQSSTVYMTFPSNRTKRYEHSLGVMQLASRMLFSSIANADEKTTSSFFDELENRFADVYDSIMETCNDQNGGGGYFSKIKDYMNEAFDERNNGINCFWDSVEKTVLPENMNDGDGNFFSEFALNQFQYYPMVRDTAAQNSVSIEIRRVFLYRCLLQALRIVALFHDVGHPPYSHIIEEVLTDLPKTHDMSTWDETKKNDFVRCMKRFVSSDSRDAFKCNSIYVKKSLRKGHTHERIGFSLLQYAFSAAIERMIIQYRNETDSADAFRAISIYLITAAEFSLAILSNYDTFFEAVHSIVDGIMDADRLDYIVRDTYNSGVDWGDIPYDRLIIPMKMMKYTAGSEEGFVFAFPRKLEEDINDILITRYKLFTKINFHHKCKKTAVALQTCVRLLAIDYLTHKNDNDCINPEIAVLWTALSSTSGEFRRRIMQWNDSFLISTLHKSLVKIGNSKKSSDALLKTNLEEILLNTKKYYSFIKRGQDSKAFIDLVLKKANISREALEKFRGEEFYKCKVTEDQYHATSNPDEKLTQDYSNAKDSVARSKNLLILADTGDLELFGACGLENADDLFIKELEAMKSEGKIDDYRSVTCTERSKIGLPKHESIFDEIYLYDGSSEAVPLDINVSLKPQIITMMHSSPWIYTYVKPPGSTGRPTSSSEFNVMMKEVRERLSDALANELHRQETSIFGSYNIHQ